MLSVRVVLVQPRNPLNILAAARAARNFGLGDIAVVDVQPRAWAEALEKDVDRETPHGPRNTSRGWLGDARKYDTLVEAIGECSWVLGTSSLDRRRVDAEEVIDLRDLPARITAACGVSSASFLQATGKASGRNAGATRPPSATRHSLITNRIAILFGSEKRGLTNEHLMHCQNVLWIPTVNTMPSMNLGQAVAVVCYELARSGFLPTLEEQLPVAEFSGGGSEAVTVKSKSKITKDSGASVRARGTEGAGDAKGSELAKESEFSTDSRKMRHSVYSGAKKESKEAANAAERQSLLEQMSDLVKGPSVSSTSPRIGTRQRNLCKLISKLPLTRDDVRLLLGVVKDARNANAAAAGQSREPRKPPLP